MDKRSKAAWLFRTLTIVSLIGVLAVTALLLYTLAYNEEKSNNNRALLCQVPAIMQSEYCDAIRSQLDRKR